MTSPAIYSFVPIISNSQPDIILKKNDWSINCLTPPGSKLSQQEKLQLLLDKAAEIEFLITDIAPINEEFMSKAKKLRMVNMFGVGLDHIDIPSATKNQILITNAPGINARSTAELTVGMLFALARKIIPMHNLFVQNTWKGMQGVELFEKTLGVIGFGSIGSSVARIGKGIGMNVLVYNRSPKPKLAAEIGCKQVELEELLNNSDFVTLNLPALPDNKPLITAKELEMMKSGAFIVNTGRGSLIDLEALVSALNNKKLAGAGLDVFPQEPLTTEMMDAMPHQLYKMPNVVLTPHIGSSTSDARDKVGASCLNEIQKLLDGERSINVKNPEVYIKIGL